MLNKAGKSAGLVGASSKCSSLGRRAVVVVEETLEITTSKYSTADGGDDSRGVAVHCIDARPIRQDVRTRVTTVQMNSTVPRADLRRARARIGRRTVECAFTTPEQLQLSAGVRADAGMLTQDRIA